MPSGNPLTQISLSQWRRAVSLRSCKLIPRSLHQIRVLWHTRANFRYFKQMSKRYIQLQGSGISLEMAISLQLSPCDWFEICIQRLMKLRNHMVQVIRELWASILYRKWWKCRVPLSPIYTYLHFLSYLKANFLISDKCFHIHLGLTCHPLSRFLSLPSELFGIPTRM